MENFKTAVARALENLSGEFGFLICFGIIFFAFVGGLSVILSCDFDFKKRLSFLLFTAGICVAELAVDLSCKVSPWLCAVNFGVAVAECAVLLCLPRKKREVTQEQREFVKYIDNKIKDGTVIKLSAKPTEEKKYDKRLDIDFSHVKSVIDRINGCGLSLPDKKIVQSLSGSLAEAEKGEPSQELKEKINDGLGALLKIMSKYGV